MIGHLVQAVGSPCPTLVLDARLLPRAPEARLAVLTQARRYLAAAGGAHVLKFALVEPSTHPLCDLDYHFVQALPDRADHFDLRGSCGHSVLAAVVAAARSGLVAPLSPGSRIRVNVRNNDDYIACHVDEITPGHVGFTVHFLQPAPVPLKNMLMTGAARTVLDVGGTSYSVSLISVGNPYVFVDAAELGAATTDELMTGGDALFDRLRRIRRAAAALLGWPPDGAFPKAAAVAPAGHGELAVRAISVPRWHPTIALTGAVCVAAATLVTGTVPWTAAQLAGGCDGQLVLRTPGEPVPVTAATRTTADDGERLAWLSVGGKKAVFQGSFFVEPLAHLQFEEVVQCLALSTATG